MKTIPRLLLGAALAFFGVFTLEVWAQTPASTTDTSSASAPAATTATVSAAPTAPTPTTIAPTATTSSTDSVAAQKSSPSAEPAPAATAPSTATPTAAEPAASAAPTANEKDDPALRHIDQPTAATTSQPTDETPRRRGRRATYHGGDNARVQIGGDALLGKGESADAVVAICGNATSDGDVAQGVVAVAGNARATGTVGDGVVAVLGNVYVDGDVHDVVAVLGNVELGPNAVVHGNVVDVGGTVKRDSKAVVFGKTPHVGFAIVNFGDLGWLHTYASQCLFKGRLLAIAPGLGWAWGIAFGFLLLYAAFALLFRTGVDKCVTTLETRPGSSIVTALLTVLLAPVLIILLVVSVVGIAVVPFVILALALGTLFGKASLLAWLGRRVTRLFGEGPLSHPVFGVLIGGVIIMALYLVPVLGIVLYKVIGVLGLGLVVLTLFGTRRSRPARLDAVAPTGAIAVGMAPSGGTAGVLIGEPAIAATPPPVVAPATLPRAGFWIRIGGLLIDCVVAFAALIFLHVGPGILLLLGVYGAIMWKLKGTTIGGIVCGLQVVRLDGRPIDWPTAIVRALSCFLSLFAIGLGFIWVALDEDKQSWHDKVAGTTVVLTRSTSLV
jgi:uncharacterized RDD family membrane protein YckC